ncbi:MerR family transcriptional regulator [Desulfovibrio litoralis]|uniref:MerR HTH family regulatory protein n=1 Tax=Desulfovibrio litoralis DSM 11393 TaxID=1121455 RepID=A0A1M7SY84_9BACT|nr:MerR family transcriptional regulator [Desulfovibrio litoralis]SHN63447.1 MerR HTH family regulatory protein [Desulfovibrio litoralis DSM 11393]
MSEKTHNKNDSPPSLTHKGLAEFLGVSETTVKSYRRKFPDCIPVANMGKPIRFTPEAVKVCLKIRDFFEQGMSIIEVRERLSQEFSWISAKAEKTQTNQNAIDKEQTPQDVKNILGSLSKAMITITQQQNTILKKVQRLEEKVQIETSSTPENTQQHFDSTRENHGNITERLEKYEEKLNSLSRSFDNISTQLSGLVQDMIAPILGQKIEQSLEYALNKKFNNLSGSDDNNQLQPQKATVMSFPKSTDVDQLINVDQPTTGINEQPPRELLALPLIIRSLKGEYISVADKSKGRFSLNDLKAILAYNSPPPNNFVLRWEKDTAGWWFVIEQTKNEHPRCLRLLLVESNTQKGESVVIATRITDNGTDVHPSELLPFIHGLSE